MSEGMKAIKLQEIFESIVQIGKEGLERLKGEDKFMLAAKTEALLRDPTIYKFSSGLADPERAEELHKQIAEEFNTFIKHHQDSAGKKNPYITGKKNPFFKYFILMGAEQAIKFAHDPQDKAYCQIYLDDLTSIQEGQQYFQEKWEEIRQQIEQNSPRKLQDWEIQIGVNAVRGLENIAERREKNIEIAQKEKSQYMSDISDDETEMLGNYLKSGAREAKDAVTTAEIQYNEAKALAQNCGKEFKEFVKQHADSKGFLVLAKMALKRYANNDQLEVKYHVKAGYKEPTEQDLNNSLAYARLAFSVAQKALGQLGIEKERYRADEAKLKSFRDAIISELRVQMEAAELKGWIYANKMSTKDHHDRAVDNYTDALMSILAIHHNKPLLSEGPDIELENGQDKDEFYAESYNSILKNFTRSILSLVKSTLNPELREKNNELFDRILEQFANINVTEARALQQKIHALFKYAKYISSNPELYVDNKIKFCTEELILALHQKIDQQGAILENIIAKEQEIVNIRSNRLLNLYCEGFIRSFTQAYHGAVGISTGAFKTSNEPQSFGLGAAMWVLNLAEKVGIPCAGLVKSGVEMYNHEIIKIRSARIASIAPGSVALEKFAQSFAISLISIKKDQILNPHNSGSVSKFMQMFDTFIDKIKQLKLAIIGDEELHRDIQSKMGFADASLIISCVVEDNHFVKQDTPAKRAEAVFSYIQNNRDKLFLDVENKALSQIISTLDEAVQKFLPEYKYVRNFVNLGPDGIEVDVAGVQIQGNTQRFKAEGYGLKGELTKDRLYAEGGGLKLNATPQRTTLELDDPKASPRYMETERSLYQKTGSDTMGHYSPKSMSPSTQHKEVKSSPTYCESYSSSNNRCDDKIKTCSKRCCSKIKHTCTLLPVEIVYDNKLLNDPWVFNAVISKIGFDEAVELGESLTKQITLGGYAAQMPIDDAVDMILSGSNLDNSELS